MGQNILSLRFMKIYIQNLMYGKNLFLIIPFLLQISNHYSILYHFIQTLIQKMHTVYIHSQYGAWI